MDYQTLKESIRKYDLPLLLFGGHRVAGVGGAPIAIIGGTSGLIAPRSRKSRGMVGVLMIGPTFGCAPPIFLRRLG